MKDPLGAPAFTRIETNIGNYAKPPLPRQPNGTVITDRYDARLMNLVSTKNFSDNNPASFRMFGTFGEGGKFQGNVASMRFFNINPTTNALIDNKSYGNDNIHWSYPQVAADFGNARQAVITVTRSAVAANNYASVHMLGISNGALQQQYIIKSGVTNSAGNRWRDYQGGTIDWEDYFHNIGGGRKGVAKLWGYGETVAGGGQ